MIKGKTKNIYNQAIHTEPLNLMKIALTLGCDIEIINENETKYINKKDKEKVHYIINNRYMGKNEYEQYKNKENLNEKLHRILPNKNREKKVKI